MVPFEQPGPLGTLRKAESIHVRYQVFTYSALTGYCKSQEYSTMAKHGHD